jgi:signal transduction histidine kinase
MVHSRPEMTSSRLRWNERLVSWLPPVTSFHSQIRLWRWLIPVGLVVLVVFYEIGPSRWIYERLGFTTHLTVEVLVFGTVGPALAFAVLVLLGRWLDERDTSDFQAQLLARARNEVESSRQLNDDALQILFSAGTLFSTFKNDVPEVPPETAAELEAAEQALNEAIQRLRAHLLS